MKSHIVHARTQKTFACRPAKIAIDKGGIIVPKSGGDAPYPIRYVRVGLVCQYAACHPIFYKSIAGFSRLQKVLPADPHTIFTHTHEIIFTGAVGCAGTTEKILTHLGFLALLR